MKRALVASLLALALTGTAAFAGGYGDTIRQSYESAGYSNIEVREVDGKWLVTGDKDGRPFRYIVDAKTGQSVEVANGSPDAALFDGTGTAAGTAAGTKGGLVMGTASSTVSGQNTGSTSGGDDDSEHSGSEQSETERGESGGESD